MPTPHKKPVCPTLYVTRFYPQVFKPNPSLKIHAEESMHSRTALPKLILRDITSVSTLKSIGVGGYLNQSALDNLAYFPLITLDSILKCGQSPEQSVTLSMLGLSCSKL